MLRWFRDSRVMLTVGVSLNVYTVLVAEPWVATVFALAGAILVAVAVAVLFGEDVDRG